MIKNFTENDILLYIYGEVDALEAEHIEIALLTDPLLNNFFMECTSIIEHINQVMLSPCEETISKILAQIA